MSKLQEENGMSESNSLDASGFNTNEEPVSTNDQSKINTSRNTRLSLKHIGLFSDLCSDFLKKTKTYIDIDRSTQVNLLIDYTKLNSSVNKFMRQIKSKLGVSPVRTILMKELNSWEFSSLSAHFYRGRAALLSLTSKGRHYPRVFSFFIRPELEDKKTTFYIESLVQETSLKKISVTLNLNEPACELIKKTVEGFAADKTGEYVLKAAGFNAFIFGKKKLVSFAYIQDFTYHNKPILLTFEKRVEEAEATFSKFREHYRAMYKDSVSIAQGSIKSVFQMEKMVPVHTSDYFSRFHDKQHVDKQTGNHVSSCLEEDENSTVNTSHSKFWAAQIMEIPFSIQITKITGLKFHETWLYNSSVELRVKIIYGNSTLNAKVFKTHKVSFNTDVNFDTVFSLSHISNIPREAKIVFLLYVHKNDAEKARLQYFLVQNLFSESSLLLQGRREFSLWPIDKAENEDHPFYYQTAAVENRLVADLENKDKVALFVTFPSFLKPICFSESLETPHNTGREVRWESLHQETRKKLKKALSKDTLSPLSKPEKELIWISRNFLIHNAKFLFKFLESANWQHLSHRREVYYLLREWNKNLSLEQALCLLNYIFPDRKVRALAVARLRRFSIAEIEPYILQLVQCLKYETYHVSPLSSFLIEIVCKLPSRLCHGFYWALKTEAEYIPFYKERFVLFIEEMLSRVGNYNYTLLQQINTLQKIKKIAMKVKKDKAEQTLSDSQVKERFKEDLKNLNKNWLSQIKYFQNPVNPSMNIKEVIVDHCKYFSSKMVPLLLVFKTDDPFGESFSLILKCGDDLRQDALTLQMMIIMDRLWSLAGFDMKLTPYAALALGAGDDLKGVGVLQAVTSAETTSEIQIGFGGTLMGALKINTIYKYIATHNSEKHRNDAIENLVYSCAAYCVATGILGIGDRHNGNIMIKRDGHLFHIDFGHFLGNFKSKYGIKRERSAFVFLPEMAYAMGGNNYLKSQNYILFKSLCIHIFNVLRKNSQSFLTLFDLMVGAGMPELICREDINYLKEMLKLDSSEKEAGEFFSQELENSLNTTSRRVDNLFHNLKHG